MKLSTAILLVVDIGAVSGVAHVVRESGGHLTDPLTLVSVVSPGIPLLAFIVLRRWADQDMPSRPQSGRRWSQAAWKATWWAAKLAGERREMLEPWRAHLVGDPENGVALTPRQQQWLALGFAVAAIRYRLHDALQPLWRPVDWFLSSDSRTNSFVSALVGGQAIYIVDDGGIPALVTEVWEPCGILGGALYVLTRWLRKVRCIELAKTRKASKEE
uniref:Uncharacterized protein n=1 Tax=Streptomyces sp. NBC_00093 TaxID=2975649 RepID=A0AAU2A516_9ACTN